MSTSVNKRSSGSREPANTEIGARLRGFRKARGWTQGDLAKRCGLAVSTISKVETGQLSPSFETLLRIAEGLSVNLGDLMTVSADESEKTRRAYTRKGMGELHETGAYVYELLCGEIKHKLMHPLVAILKAHSVNEFGGLLAHPGEEVLYVLDGTVEVLTEHYKPLRLVAGDCAYFDSTMGHGCISVGEDDARIFWVSTSNTLGT